MPVRQLNISVSDIGQVLQSFDVIRIKRSTTGVSGVYSLITADVPVAAILTAPNAGNYSVATKTLQILVDRGSQIDILFLGTAPLTTAQVVSQVNTAVGEDIASESDNKLVLTSTNTGTISRIEIVGGDAAPIFGWTDGERDIGEEVHITLQAGVSNYTFMDQDGAAAYFYKAQFYHTSTELQSSDSLPFVGGAVTLVSAEKLSTVKVDLVDGQGIALPNQEITFYPMQEFLGVEGFQVALNRAPITIETDNSGHAEVILVRGLRVRVLFEGTSVIRDITVPDAPEFDLLSAMSSVPDPFDIVDLPFPTAPRRTS